MFAKMMKKQGARSWHLSSNLRFDMQLALLIICGIILAFTLGSFEQEVSSDTSSSAKPVAQTTGAILPVDVNGVLNGDYSSVVGTWKSDKGTSLTFDTAGQATFKNRKGRISKGTIYNARLQDGRLQAQFKTKSGRILSIFVIPAGTPTKYLDYNYQKDAVLVNTKPSDDGQPFYR